MAGWERKNRLEVPESVPNGTDCLKAEIVAAGETEGHPFTKYATYCLTEEKAIARGPGGGSPAHFGLKANKTTEEKGAIALYAKSTKVRGYTSIWLGEKPAENTGTVLCGFSVLAQDDNATPANGRAIFAGYSSAAEGKERQWVIATDSSAGLKTTEASLTATSLGAGGLIGRPIKVEVDGSIVRLYTPDGILEHDYAAKLGELGEWYGVRCRQPKSVTANQSAYLDAIDFQVYESSYAPINSKWEDTYAAMANPAILWEFGIGSEFTRKAGETPTYSPTSRFDLFGQSLQATFNTTTAQRYEYELPAALDLTGRDLALFYKFQAPDQLTYNKPATLAAEVSKATVESANFTMEATAETPFEGATKMQAPGVVVVKVGEVFVVISVASREGKKLKGCNLLLGTAAAIPAAAKLWQHNGVDNSFTTVSVYCAESSTAMGENKYWRFVAPNWGHGSPSITTWPTAVGNALGPEAREGSGGKADLTKVKYLKVQFETTATLPKSGAEYEGPQQNVSTYVMNLGGVVAFDHVDKPTVVVSYDDAHDSNVKVGEIASQFGVTVALFDILDNVDGGSGHVSEAEWLALMKEGHEAGIHTRYQKNHGDPGTPTFFGQGPWHHLGIVAPTVVPAEFEEGKKYLEGKGIAGPFAGAWALGEGTTPANASSLRDLSVKVFRSTNGGGVSDSDFTTTGEGPGTKVTGVSLASLTMRMGTWPAGDMHRLPGDGVSAEIKAGDGQGHKLAIRSAYEAIKKGCIKTFYSHVLVPDGEEPTGGQWTETMLKEFLGALKDWKEGTNVYGFNVNGAAGAKETFASLRVVGLHEAVTGEAQAGVSSGTPTFPLSRHNRIVNP